MEWDLKIPPWDLPELELSAAEANLSSVVGSSARNAGRQPGGLYCSVDLKLGGLGDFGLDDKWKEQRRASTASMTPEISAGSLKRPRAPGSGSQNVSCLVDGCKNDLSNCREYHRRHKVCEVHSKTPIVLVGGQEQRFCQQCSRFHLLVEFDEVKRSCRKRLDGHNRRRRKHQPESINSGNLFSNNHGTRFTSFPQVFPTAATDTTWSAIVKSEENTVYSHQPPPMMQQRPQQFGSSFNQSFKQGKQSPFPNVGDTVLGSRTALDPTAVCQPLLKTISSAAGSSGSKAMFSGGLPPVLDSDCALSLLSSSTQTSGINLGQVMPMDRIPIGRPLPSTMQYNTDIGRLFRSQSASDNVLATGFSCSAVENEHVGTLLVSDVSGADLHYQNIFHVGEGSSDGASQSLSFSWQ